MAGLSFAWVTRSASGPFVVHAKVRLSNVDETLTIKLPSNRIAAFVQTIARDSAFDDSGVTVNVSPSMDQRRAATVGTASPNWRTTV